MREQDDARGAEQAGGAYPLHDAANIQTVRPDTSPERLPLPDVGPCRLHLLAEDALVRVVAHGADGVEDSLGISVNCFHLDCLASEVRLNVDLDVALTVIAHGCYRWLAKRLRGFDRAKPKQLYRRFVETAGVVEVRADRLVIHFDKRSPNPILREAELDRDCPPIPWLCQLPVTFQYP